jgi:hypothetical protein
MPKPVAVAVVFAVGLGALATFPCLAQEPSPGRIQGELRIFGQTPSRAIVELTAYADSICVVISRKPQRTQAEGKQLQECRRAKIRSVESWDNGVFVFADVQPGLYSISFRWFPTNFPIFCDKPTPEAWLVAREQDTEGRHGVVASGEAFEVKAGERVEKWFYWCQ